MWEFHCLLCCFFSNLKSRSKPPSFCNTLSWSATNFTHNLLNESSGKAREERDPNLMRISAASVSAEIHSLLLSFVDAGPNWSWITIPLYSAQCMSTCNDVFSFLITSRIKSIPLNVSRIISFDVTLLLCPSSLTLFAHDSAVSKQIVSACVRKWMCVGCFDSIHNFVGAVRGGGRSGSVCKQSATKVVLLFRQNYYVAEERNLCRVVV